MPIRPAKSSDFAIIVSILTQGFWDESFVSTFLHPKRDKFPDDIERYWRRHIRPDWYDPDNHFLVAVDAATNKVIGVANWKRNIPQERNLLARWMARLSKHLAKSLNFFDKLFFPDRAVDPSRNTAYAHAIAFFTHHWSGDRNEHWSLETLAVLPEYEGRGYGRQLVEWGLERAEEDEVCTSVVASEGTEGFYGKCGFDIQVGRVTEGEGNPLAGVRGGAILFRNARGRGDGGGQENRSL